MVLSGLESYLPLRPQQLELTGSGGSAPVGESQRQRLTGGAISNGTTPSRAPRASAPSPSLASVPASLWLSICLRRAFTGPGARILGHCGIATTVRYVHIAVRSAGPHDSPPPQHGCRTACGGMNKANTLTMDPLIEGYLRLPR